MSGAIDEIVEILTHAFDSVDRESLTRLARHILSNQFVASGGRLYKVIRGTGMGMISSGDIADWLLFWLLEKHFLLLARVR